MTWSPIERNSVKHLLRGCGLDGSAQYFLPENAASLLSKKRHFPEWGLEDMLSFQQTSIYLLAIFTLLMLVSLPNQRLAKILFMRIEPGRENKKCQEVRRGHQSNPYKY